MPMVLCERVRRHILCQFDAVSNQLVMGFHVYGMHLQLKSYQFCLSLLQFEGLTMQKIRGWQLKGESFCKRVRPILQHPASSLIVHPFSLCSVSHGLLAIDTNQLPWLPFSIQQPTSPHWLPICDRQSYWCFHSTIQFYRGQTSQIYAKTSFLADFSDGETRCNQSSKAQQTTH